MTRFLERKLGKELPAKLRFASTILEEGAEKHLLLFTTRVVDGEESLAKDFLRSFVSPLQFKKRVLKSTFFFFYSLG